MSLLVTGPVTGPDFLKLSDRADDIESRERDNSVSQN